MNDKSNLHVQIVHKRYFKIYFSYAEKVLEYHKKNVSIPKTDIISYFL